MRWLLTTLAAIGMAALGWWILFGADYVRSESTTFPPIIFVMVAASCTIWVAAPRLLKGRSSTAWILYGIASPFVGGFAAILFTMPETLAYLPSVLIFLLCASPWTVPVGLGTAFVVYLIWRRAIWQPA